MDNYQINQMLIDGKYEQPGVLPHVDNLRSMKYVFTHAFGLDVLPVEPGVISVRGPRQYGKSTWLEQQIALSIREFGKGSALYLNGDEISNREALREDVRDLVQLFPPKASVKRLFIDEITAVQDWQIAIKRLIDAGELKDILLVTTGSRAADLRRGVERLPGRKGKLSRTNYIFTPISYQEFVDKCGGDFADDKLFAYLLCGGSPMAANALAETGQIPEYVMSTVNDWVLGEFAASGRSRAHLLAVLQSLYKMAATPIGQSKLARESGLSNNTVALGYTELLADLMITIPSYPYDFGKRTSIFRKPCKYHFTNMLAALCWHPKKPRTIVELKALGEGLGPIFEWAVAQEIWRRFCIFSNDMPEQLNFWQSNTHEIDFVLPEPKILLEVKAGGSDVGDFLWFLKTFAKQNLMIINQNCFETNRVKGITLENFLLSDF